MNKLIKGAGGGGGGGSPPPQQAQRAPVEDPDSLRSIAYARILDLLSEGEIEGWADPSYPYKNIYLDDVVMQNADGSMNFSGVSLDSRTGTQNQSYMPTFSLVESEHGTGLPLQVFNSTPSTHTISNVNADQVRITIGFPALTFQDPTTGDLTGNSVSISIDIQTNGGGFVTQSLWDGGLIQGKTKTRYQRSYLLNLPKPGTTWDIRVNRLTSDTIPSNEQKQCWLDGFTEIVNKKFSFPNSALSGLSIDSSQFGQIPTRGFKIKGVKVKIPDNYNPITRVYTGTWAGTFVTAWTNNPAWIYYDLLTNPRYGLGKFVDSTQVDKWALYTIAQYCDTLVPDGFGGTEPRFACSLYLQTAEDAYKVIANMASVFRAMSYLSSGAITTVQDSPKTASALYTPANVIDGQFNYQGSALNARHTVALVTWNDPSNMYRQAVEYVEDSDGILRYGVNPINTVAFACISRGQAARWGRWILYSERLETEVVKFAVGQDGILSPPGSVINTTDPSRAGTRMGGRVTSATTTVVTIDSPITILSGKTYQLSCVLPSGAVETKNVTTGVGSTSTLTVSVAFSTAPSPLAIWVLTQNDLQPEIWRVVGLTEDSSTTGLGYEVNAIAHNPSKFASIESGLVLEVPSTSNIVITSTPVTGITFAESLYLENKDIKTMLDVTWDPSPSNIARYTVDIKRGVNGNWEPLADVVSRLATAFDVTTGTDYYARVVAFNSIGSPSLPTVAGPHTVIGKAAPPANVTGFSATANGNVVLLKWDQVPDVDLKGYEIRYNDWPSTSWESASYITQVTRGTQVTTAAIPPGDWTMLIKAIDTSGNYSTTATVYHLTLTSVNTILLNRPNAAGFYGTKTHCLVHWTGKLVPDSQDAASLSTWDTFDICVPNPYTDATYEAPEADFRVDEDARIYEDIVSYLAPGASGVPNPSLMIDYHTIAGAYDGFEAWGIGFARCRYVKYKTLLNAGGGVPIISEIRQWADAVPRIESANSVIIAPGGTAITYLSEFAFVPALTVTAEAVGGAARYGTYDSGATTTGAVLRVFNSSGTDVGGTVNWSARGI